VVMPVVGVRQKRNVLEFVTVCPITGDDIGYMVDREYYSMGDEGAQENKFNINKVSNILWQG